MMKKAAGAVVVVLALVVSAIVAFAVLYIWWPSFRQDVWQPFKDNAEPWVAIGTILLALATAGLAAATLGIARQSRREVGAVTEQTKVSLDEVEISRKALQAQARPMLVDAPRGVHFDAQGDDRGAIKFSAGAGTSEDEQIGYAECIVPMQNVGSGVALITGFEFKWFGQGWNRRALQTVVPPGQLTNFDFFRGDLDPGEADMQGWALADGPSEDFEVEVTYTDMEGEQPTRTRLLAHTVGGGRGSVSAVLLYRGDEKEPFAELTREVIPDKP
jgi:hypothetical protein